MALRNTISAFLVVFGLIFAYILLLALRFAFVEQLWFSLTVLIVAGTACAIYAVHLQRNKSKKGQTNPTEKALYSFNWWKLFIGVFAVNIPLMLLVAHFFLGASGIDYHQLFDSALAAIRNQPNPEPGTYGANPHNHFLLINMVCFFNIVFSIAPTAGNDVFLWWHVVENITAIQVSILLVAFTARKLWGNRRGGVVGLGLVFCGPIWTTCTNPYSDTHSLVFLAATLWLAAALFLQEQAWTFRRIATCIGLGFTCAVGFKIKATVAILLVAFALVAFFIWKAKQAATLVFCATLAFCIGVLGCNAFVDALRPESLAYTSQDRYEKSFPPFHWMMMGMNADAQGMFNWGDYNITADCPTYDEKVATDLATMQKRAVELGPSGLAYHILFTKTSVQWQQGSLFNYSIFTREGSLSSEDAGAWQEDRGAYGLAFAVYRNYTQVYHVFMVAGIALCAFLLLKQRRIVSERIKQVRANSTINKTTSEKKSTYTAESVNSTTESARIAMSLFCMIAIFGFGTFLCVFWEVKPRYLIHFMPLLILVATDGLVRFTELLTSGQCSKKENAA